ncbi:hypothetical protein Tco_1174899 [Tanacetum coccineum]
MGRDTIHLEDAVSTISEEYLLEFTSEYGNPEGLHSELPGPEETIMDFPEGKVGVYTKFFEFANYRIPLSQFLFDILGYYQIHLSQLSVIGAAKVSHFKINCRVLNIIPTLNLFRVFYIPSYNSGWMSFSKRPGRNTSQCYTKPLDNLKNWNNHFFWVDERIFPTVVAWSTSAPKGWDAIGRDLFRVGRDDVYPIFLDDDEREMDLFNLISAPNPAKVKTETRPRVAHEVPLLTATATHVIDMEDVTKASESLGIPSLVKKSPLDFVDKDPFLVISEGVRTRGQARDEVPHEIPPVGNPLTTKVAPDLDPEAAAMGSLICKRHRERGNGRADANAPPKVLRKGHASVRSEQSTHGGKSLTSMGLAAGSTFVIPTDAKSVNDPDPLSYAEARPYPEQEIAQSSEIPTGNVSTAEVQNLQSTESSESGNQPPSHPRSGRPKVAMGSQLRLRFEQEVRLLKKARAQKAIRD